MPIIWNAEADAKLFMGVLAQLKTLKVKLDHLALAKYMGDDVTSCAIDNRIVRLRRLVESGDAPATPSKTSSKTSKSPAKTSTKRKTADTPKSGKKSKNKVTDDEEVVDMGEGLGSVKDEDNKVKVEMQIKEEGMGRDSPGNVFLA